jgi:SAM-dependent methyltransferase
MIKLFLKNQANKTDILKVTRGSGLLEQFLAKQRSKIADHNIPDVLRNGKIIDIGCGTYPYFLNNTVFNSKYALDKMISNSILGDISIINHDINKTAMLPFENEFFDVVVMLAVIEHIEPYNLEMLFSEIKRILKYKGLFIFTTPSKWTAKLLQILAFLNIVSKYEIEEHKHAYNHNELKNVLSKANFIFNNISLGYFEFFMNIYGVVKK